MATNKLPLQNMQKLHRKLKFCQYRFLVGQIYMYFYLLNSVPTRCYIAIFGDNFPTIFDDHFKSKASAIRFTYNKSEFWSSFDIMSCSEGKDILFLQLMVSFKMKKNKRRKWNKWVQELFCKREEKGTFNNLIQKMKLADRESFLGKI